MDPMDILGGLLGGGKRGGGGLGGSILTDLLGGGRKQRSPSSTGSSPGRTSGRSSGRSSGRGPSHRHVDPQQRADELEDLLGVAKGRHSERGSAAGNRPTSSTRYESTQRNETQSHSSRNESSRTSSGFDFDARPPRGRREPLDQNEQAVLFIRAMIAAAQSDGRISETEQNEILQRLSNPSQQALNFLRREFQKSTNARDFAWEVPIGLEEQVYTMSLAAINVDTRGEMEYLKELAHGLRLAPDECNAIHRQYGARELY